MPVGLYVFVAVAEYEGVDVLVEVSVYVVVGVLV